ncbi:MAG: chalcone isomerase family protein [Desulfobacteraceae bacterium]|nr:chalcone isomerase family protein [Desulfobacteraceae bacterium]
MLKKLVVTVLAVLLAASLCPARTIENVDLPETMEIGDKTVALNGGGVRTSMYLKTYVGGLYVREAKTGADAVINADQPMAIRLHMIEDVGQQTMKTAIHNGFRSATGDNIEPIESEIDTFMECFSDPIKKGEVFEFAYLPGKGTEIYKQGELRSTIEGLEFKKAMFGIWFSDKPADKKLKKGMLAGDIRVSPEKLAPEGETAVATAEKSAEEKAVAEKAAAEKKAKEKAAAAKAAAEKEAADKAKAAEEKAVAAAEKQPDAPAAGSGAEAKAAGETAAAAGAAAGKAASGKKKDQQVAVKKSPEKNLPASATVQEAAAEETAARSKTEKPEKEKAGEKAEEKAAAAAEKQPAEKAEKQAGKKEQKVPGTSVTRAQVVEEDIYFDVNDASLSDQALDRLARKKEWLSANPDTSVYVEVYCDSRGSEDYNTWLAHKRGRSVKTYLVNKGVAPARIRVKIRGEEKSSGGENMDKSRRAHFEIKE